MGALDAFGPRSWARPEITGMARLPMAPRLGSRPAVVPSGWRFRLVDRPEKVVADDLVGSTAGWSDIAVPGCWTMQGFDRPYYTIVELPFRGTPPDPPDDNPTGVYRATLTVPSSWRGQRLVLHVAGAETVLYAYVDGRAVGMGKDSRLPHEFDVTELVSPGRSFELALIVVRWSDATYLEKQDHWHHAGLHRDVVLYATPPVRIDDVHVVADYEPSSGAGRLEARVRVEAAGDAPRGLVARVEIDDLAAEAPVRFEHPTNPWVTAFAFAGRGATLTLAVPEVSPWSAEVPRLYSARVTLLDGESVLDAVTVTVGFRRVEVRGHDLLVNGRAVLIKGVNRHDHDPRNGKTVTPQSIEADVVLMKQHNINAIRTSHYPNDEYLYEVCDRLGMYVVDEANVEAQAHLRSLTKNPIWTSAVLERIARLAQRDKSHPSVIMWSLGNESGGAPVFDAAATWLRSFDPTRAVHYEGGLGESLQLGRAAGRRASDSFALPRGDSDVIVPMYPTVADLVGWATSGRVDRPLIMCEYCHAMGNSCGGLDEYWDAVRTYAGLQGGFVWDWVDQSLLQVLPDGTERLAYGGDFGDTPNDGAFCMNGLVAADRTPHPSLLELATVVQPVQVVAVDAARGVLRVTNEYAFVDLSWLTPVWRVEVDGREVASGSLEPLSVAPGESASLQVPVPQVAVGPGERVYLTVSFVTAAELPWAPAGHEVAWFQALAGSAPGAAVAPGPRSSRSLDELEPELALWRAPIDNEVFGPRHAARWDSLGLRDAAALAKLVTDVDGDVVTHAVEVPPSLEDIPRVGVRLRVGRGVASVEWLGFGPHESYSDRRASARFGRWTTPVDDWPVPYVRPQASGNRTGVRWLRFVDVDGNAVLTIDGLDDLDVTVSRHTDDQLVGAAHLEELPPSDDCYVWLDAAHRGVGSGACGPDTAPAHRVGPGHYRWSYRLA